MTRFLVLHRWFCRESRSYVGPYTWRTRLQWPRAWLRFMWFSRHDPLPSLSTTSGASITVLLRVLVLAVALSASACATTPEPPPNVGQPAGAPLVASELKKAVDWADTAIEVARTVQKVEIEAYRNQRLSDADHRTVQEGFLAFFGAAVEALLTARDLTKTDTTRWAAAKAIGQLAVNLVARIEPHLPAEVSQYVTTLKAVLDMLGFGPPS